MTRSVTIRLELDVAGEELCGRALSPAHAPRAFTGWLGLLAALDDLLADPAAAPPPARQGAPAS